MRNYEGKRAAMGRWLYDGVIEKTVEIIAFDYDYYFELPGHDGRRTWKPYSLNVDGFLYYVRADGGEPLSMEPFQSISDAKAWVDAQPWAPIDWEN
ncbi:hypothetical protein [Hansschlegelia zhihuaiae]|uniref:Uncharacterized protein n=1 Tax=Hansschlegelia zhihuaiae TaxID=405005 RepID=A0A4Q0MJR3_9HYPH|nr:hypothetical protein [Hansschlegelia zhihuaiae]RXF73798.1 hypothetical protein EK403_09445 [Hansschlegelia zhihuaiae]